MIAPVLEVIWGGVYDMHDGPSYDRSMIAPVLEVESLKIVVDSLTNENLALKNQLAAQSTAYQLAAQSTPYDAQLNAPYGTSQYATAEYGVADYSANATGYGIADYSASATGYGVADYSAGAAGYNTGPTDYNATGYGGADYGTPAYGAAPYQQNYAAPDDDVPYPGIPSL